MAGLSDFSAASAQSTHSRASDRPLISYIFVMALILHFPTAPDSSVSLTDTIVGTGSKVQPEEQNLKYVTLV